jgi:hypothetical protein
MRPFYLSETSNTPFLQKQYALHYIVPSWLRDLVFISFGEEISIVWERQLRAFNLPPAMAKKVLWELGIPQGHA